MLKRITAQFNYLPSSLKQNLIFIHIYTHLVQKYKLFTAMKDENFILQCSVKMCYICPCHTFVKTQNDEILSVVIVHPYTCIGMDAKPKLSLHSNWFQVLKRKVMYVLCIDISKWKLLCEYMVHLWISKKLIISFIFPVCLSTVHYLPDWVQMLYGMYLLSHYFMAPLRENVFFFISSNLSYSHEFGLFLSYQSKI